MNNCLTIGLLGAIAFSGPCPRHLGAVEYQSRIPADTTRTWIGPEFWANRLQDWRIADGRIECLADQRRLRMRTLHLLTHRLSGQSAPFEISVTTGLIPRPSETPGNAAAGFLIGAGGKAMDYQSAAIIHGSAGKGAGYFCGIAASGEVFIHDFTRPLQEVGFQEPIGEASLSLKAVPQGESFELTLTARDPASDRIIGSAQEMVPAARLAGNVALVSHPGTTGTGSGQFWFRDWRLSGDKVEHDASRTFGPIVSTQYTLSKGILKLTAQMAPLGENDRDTIELEVEGDDGWKSVATAKIIAPGWTATFRVPDWDDERDTPYRVSYRLKPGDGDGKPFYWGGTIRRDPVDKETIVVAGFTGNHNNSHGIDQQPFDWTTGVWFPHDEVTRHVALQEPDLLFFSGDQVYEGDSPSFPDREQIELDYMYKWYLWCWAYRDLCRDIPCIAIPDDHDVYQGNIWGEGGRQTDKDDKGGYVHPAEFVKMVERTQTSNLPDAYDPTPIEQGIGVYYTDLLLGRISLAVIEDRKFKSGCNGRVPDGGANRADHIVDPAFDVSRADVPGLKLLGDRQIEFLDHWVGDWSGADIKMAVSQTMFAGMATHHGANLQYLIADLDSNGWPQSGRQRALEVLRKGFAFHLGGDQHLATIVHHGIASHGDAIWSFCVPSVANFYPRMWMPPAEGRNRPEGAPSWMGEHFDGLKNRVTVYAATNPGPATGREPAELHDKMPGYGIVRLNKDKRTITMECWPRYANPNDPSTGSQYPGWPKTIRQQDNYAREPSGYLPELVVSGMTDPVVKIVQSDGELVYAIRIRGDRFRPPVFADGEYAAEIGEPSSDTTKRLTGLKPAGQGDGEVVEVQF